MPLTDQITDFITRAHLFLSYYITQVLWLYTNIIVHTLGSTREKNYFSSFGISRSHAERADHRYSRTKTTQRVGLPGSHLEENKDKLAISFKYIYIHTFVTFVCDVCLMCADLLLQNLHF